MTHAQYVQEVDSSRSATDPRVLCRNGLAASRKSPTLVTRMSIANRRRPSRVRDFSHNHAGHSRSSSHSPRYPVRRARRCRPAHVAPAAARRRLMPPMPSAPPVTTATWPANRANVTGTAYFVSGCRYRGNGDINSRSNLQRRHAIVRQCDAFRTGYPLSSARDRNCFSANWRARPDSGIRMPAHTPSAPGVRQASCAHRQRSGHARQSAIAPSSTVVVHRSGSRVHAPFDDSSITVGPTDTSCTELAFRIHQTRQQYICMVDTIQTYCLL